MINITNIFIEVNSKLINVNDLTKEEYRDYQNKAMIPYEMIIEKRITDKLKHATPERR